MSRITNSKFLKLLIYLTTIGWSVGQNVNIPENPCPNVFSYVYDNSGNIMGQITLPNNGEGYIELEVNVSLATNSKNPNIELERAEQDLTDCRPSIFYLMLPFRNNIPRVTRIYFNGNVLCSGPKERLVPGGRPVWNMWRKSSYNTSQRFTCRTKQPQPENNSGLFLNIGNVDFAKPITTGQNRFFNTPWINSLPTVPQNTLDMNHSLNPQFPNRESFIPSIPQPTRPTPPPTKRTPTPSTTGREQCGVSKRKSHVTNLSFGGVDVPDNEFPWMGAIMHKSEENRFTFACTGTLVSLRFVITNGHCVDFNGFGLLSEKELLVVFSIRDITNWFLDNVVRKVSNIILKPGIEPYKSNHDIALIQMEKEVEYIADKIVPICLWSGSDDSNDNDLDKLIKRNPGIVVGWGNTNTTIKTLNKIEVPVISHFICIQSSTLPPNAVEKYTFCGGYGDGKTGTCSTDAGASFNVQMVDGGPWLLRGVLSITPSNSDSECNFKGYSLYVDLAYHYDWLHNIINRTQF